MKVLSTTARIAPALRGARLPAPLCAAALVAGLLCQPGHAQVTGRPQVRLQCVSHGSGPLLDCTADLRQRDGSPLVGATVTLGALMPSMPMAHTVRPVAAPPTGQPGQYRGTLELEMLGVWSVEVDIRGPVRDRSAHALRVEECPGTQRCPVAPARPAAKP